MKQLFLFFTLLFALSGAANATTLKIDTALVNDFKNNATDTIADNFNIMGQRDLLYRNGGLSSDMSTFDIDMPEERFWVNKDYFVHAYENGIEFGFMELTLIFPQSYLDSNATAVDPSATVVTGHGEESMTVGQYIGKDNIKIVNGICFAKGKTYLGSQWNGDMYYNFNTLVGDDLDIKLIIVWKLIPSN